MTCIHSYEGCADFVPRADGHQSHHASLFAVRSDAGQCQVISGAHQSHDASIFKLRSSKRDKSGSESKNVQAKEKSACKARCKDDCQKSKEECKAAYKKCVRPPKQKRHSCTKACKKAGLESETWLSLILDPIQRRAMLAGFL